jgi:hypothetical protein
MALALFRLTVLVAIALDVTRGQADAATPASSASSALRRDIAFPPPEQTMDSMEYEEWNPYVQDRNLASKEPPAQITQYTIWKPEEIAGRLTRWADHYPDLIRVTTSQDAYQLPAAGRATDCPFDEDQDGCLNYIAVLQDYLAYPEGSEAGKRLPEVLLSGCLHGNEQVGPTAVMEAVALLLEAASCTAYPRWSLRDNPTEWANDVNRARACRQEWQDYGYEDWQREWLARLVTTRRIVVVPTANALGYYQAKREENGIDPNRDFPYDLSDPAMCMQTIAARTLNEVFREHIFQMSLTFHAGMEVIAYEWGAPTYSGGLSPDDTAQKEIASAYSRFGGGFTHSRPYKYGNMNELVYPVRGGMEDWAYAGSWDPQRVIQCQPKTFDGYPSAQTQYDDATLRAFNMLVETSDNKMPKQNLGNSVNILGAAPEENGHVARNLRLALLAVELVQPWAAIRQVNEVVLSDDLIPLLDRTERASCQQAKHLEVPRDSRKVTIQWEVGGALAVEDTRIWYAKWSDIPADQLGCLDQPSKTIMELMQEGTPISKTEGKSRFAQQAGGFVHFTASIDISKYKPHDKIVVLASAKVDPEWAQMPDTFFLPKNTPPQSHMANARTNPNWYYESSTSGHIVEGRLHWFSDPVTIELSEIASRKSVDTVEISQRVPVGPQPGKRPSGGAASLSPPKSSLAHKLAMTAFLLMGVLALWVGGRSVWRSSLRQTHRDRLRDFISDPSAPSPGLAESDGSAGNRRRRNRSAKGQQVRTDSDHEGLNGAGNGELEENGDLELKVYSDNAETVV